MLISVNENLALFSIFTVSGKSTPLIDNLCDSYLIWYPLPDAVGTQNNKFPLEI